MRDLALIGSVVVHRPDLLVAAAAAHKVNLAFGNAGYAAAEPEDNLVGKFVRDNTGFITGGRILILFSEHLWRRDVLHVVKPSLHGYIIARNAQVAEREHRSIDRSSIPDIELYLSRIAGNRQRIEALRRHVEDAGIVQIVPQRGIKNFEQVSILRIRSGRLEVRDSQANLLHSQAGAGFDPILLSQTGNGGKNRSQKQKKHSSARFDFQVARAGRPLADTSL